MMALADLIVDPIEDEVNDGGRLEEEAFDGGQGSTSIWSNDLDQIWIYFFQICFSGFSLF